jgi:hypothetical protein
VNPELYFDGSREGSRRKDTFMTDHVLMRFGDERRELPLILFKRRIWPLESRMKNIRQEKGA